MLWCVDVEGDSTTERGPRKKPSVQMESAVRRVPNEAAPHAVTGLIGNLTPPMQSVCGFVCRYAALAQEQNSALLGAVDRCTCAPAHGRVCVRACLRAFELACVDGLQMCWSQSLCGRCPILRAMHSALDVGVEVSVFNTPLRLRLGGEDTNMRTRSLVEIT